MNTKLNTIIIGGGQAGLALSYCLKQHGHEHIVLEQADMPANAWRNGRWDSFTLVTPNWSVQLPGADYNGDNPDGFMSRDEVVAYLEAYIERYDLPVQFNTRVNEVIAVPMGSGYFISTDDDVYKAANVVVATGMFQSPKIPGFSAHIAERIEQIHSCSYRKPEALAPGAVLVVGSGQSGAQIAEELYKHGRKVYLSVGRAGRGPRRYRGRDIYEWLTLLGERKVGQLPSPEAKFMGSPHVSGTKGGHSLNLHQFASDGVKLLGRLESATGEKLTIAGDLRENLAHSDKLERRLVEAVDNYIQEAELEAPEEELPQLQDGFGVEMIHELDLDEANISTIIWATGYSFDFTMVKLPVQDEFGYPIQERGVTDYPGLHFIGMPWLHTQSSGLLAGVGKDAEYLAGVIVDASHESAESVSLGENSNGNRQYF